MMRLCGGNKGTYITAHISRERIQQGIDEVEK